MSDPLIIGIMLVHNEDRFLRWAVENILGFCDKILIAEHRSTDATWEIAQDLAAAHPKISAARIQRPEESSEMLQPYAGKAAWVLGVDGDEIYDPAGLARTRSRITAGEWDRWWVVFGNVLNCSALDPEHQRAIGWMAPPCRSMTKLYNFAAIDRVDPQAKQRLMGRNDAFKPGWDASLRHQLYKSTSWDEADFRCLHLCFLPRSGAQAARARSRENLTELGQRSPLVWARRMLARVRGDSASSSYKLEKYSRGEKVTIDTTAFYL